MKELLNQFQQFTASGDLLLIQALVFLFVVTVVAVPALILLTKKAPAKRLNKILGNGRSATARKSKLLPTQEGGVVAKVTKPLQSLSSPKNLEEQKKSRLRLLQAGFRSQGSYRNYFALKVLLVVFLPGLFLLSSMFFTFTPQAMLICLCLAVAGYILPTFVLDFLIRRRQHGMIKALPDALDLMVICVESGLGLDMTFQRVGNEIASMNKHLSEEFHLVNREVRAGRPRNESLKNMNLRTGIDEIQNLTTMLVQTNRFGTSLAKAMRVHADAMRVKRRQQAEERAAKTAVKLTLPLIFFIFPAILVVIIGPGGVRIMKTLMPILQSAN